MSNTNNAGFGNMIPGFDFLKNLQSQGAAAGMGPSAWVAPTLDPQELEKRIQELKAVQFWLNQNTQAIAATIQALEVQRMTLTTLKSMNVSMADLIVLGGVAAIEAAAAAGGHSVNVTVSTGRGDATPAQTGAVNLSGGPVVRDFAF